MKWYHIFALLSLAICLASLAYHLIRLIRLGRPRDFSRQRGDVGQAIRYSLTGAMSPLKKESAYMHLPTYSAGILYHLGTFLSAGLFPFLMAGIHIPLVIRFILILFTALSSIAGAGILMKRSLKMALRHLSGPDDYLSNLLVTGFQALTALALWLPAMLPAYFIWTALLLLYLPVGKLKHLVYFFAARFHLGFFYGWRNVWPPAKTDHHGTA